MHVSVQWLVEPRCEHWGKHRQTESLWSCLLFKASWSFSIQDRWPNSDRPLQGVNIKCIGTKMQTVPSASLYPSRGRSLCASLVCLYPVQRARSDVPPKTRTNAHFQFFNHTSMTVCCVTCTVFTRVLKMGATQQPCPWRSYSEYAFTFRGYVHPLLFLT